MSRAASAAWIRSTAPISALKLAHPDIGSMLEKLHLPAVAAGPLTADARLTDAGDLTRLDLAAKLGDITVKVGGTLRALGLPGSDLRIEASVRGRRPPGGGVRRDRPAGRRPRARRPLHLLAHGNQARRAEREIRRRKSAGERNTPPGARTERRPALRARRREPAQAAAGAAGDPVSVSGNYAGNRDKLEVKNLKGRIGENEFSGRASMVGTGRKRVDVELASPRLDLTPFLAEGSAKGRSAQPKKAEGSLSSTRRRCPSTS